MLISEEFRRGGGKKSEVIQMAKKPVQMDENGKRKFGMRDCLAYAAGTIAERPIKQGRTKIRDRYFHDLHLSDGTHPLLHRREGGDIWQGLYEFPLIETASACDAPTLAANPTFQQWLGGQSYQIESEQSMRPHQLSHQRLHATFFRIRVATLPAIEGTQPIAEERLGEYAVARLIDRYLELCDRN